MKIKVDVDVSKALRLMSRLSGPEMRQAAASALTDAAYEARRVVQREMDASFDKVTPYVRRSVQVTPASPQTLQAEVEPRYMGGKGVDPKNVLQAEVFGGSRKHKKSERAFQRVGILPPGYAIVPGEKCPLDAYGNIKGSFIVQLLSYFNAFGEQGYKANMTDRRRAKLAGRAANANGYRTILGVEYFVSYGKLRGGRDAHLPPGIWARSGIHGVQLDPILMFVRRPTYKKRLDFFGKPVAAARAKFNPRFRFHMRTLLERKA